MRLRFKHTMLETNHLILAIPCSTLREVDVEPGLIPSDQWEAIQTLHDGTNAKILLPVLQKPPQPTFGFGKEALFGFNRDRSVLTAYLAGETGLFFPLERTRRSSAPLLFPQRKVGSPVALAWGNEPFSKGSYSNYGKGQYEIFNQTIKEQGEEVRRVFRSIDNALFLAGEHTSVKSPATLEGAVDAGQKAARILSK